MWFYQEADEPESSVHQEQPKPGPSRAAGTSNSSKTPQGRKSKDHFILTSHHFACLQLFIHRC